MEQVGGPWAGVGSVCKGWAGSRGAGPVERHFWGSPGLCGWWLRPGKGRTWVELGPLEGMACVRGGICGGLGVWAWGL